MKASNLAKELRAREAGDSKAKIDALKKQSKAAEEKARKDRRRRQQEGRWKPVGQRRRRGRGRRVRRPRPRRR